MENTGLHDEALFDYLVGRFETETWFALGKIVNPATGQSERHLEMAKLAIDVLAMLERKTEGHLTEAQLRRLKNALTTLRLNYVEEMSKPPAGEPAAQQQSEESPIRSEDL